MSGVWLARGVPVILRPTPDDEVELDVDPREPQGLKGMSVLCWFLATLGRCLGRSVVRAKLITGARCSESIPRPATWCSQRPQP